MLFWQKKRQERHYKEATEQLIRKEKKFKREQEEKLKKALYEEKLLNPPQIKKNLIEWKRGDLNSFEGYFKKEKIFRVKLYSLKVLKKSVIQENKIFYYAPDLITLQKKANDLLTKFVSSSIS
jgi:hypothetical protein